MAMRLRVIACEVVAREIFHLAARVEPVVDITLVTRGLHDLGPDRMRRRLQEEIDSTNPELYDAVALGYALCSRGTEGLLAREVPVAVPRAHDCITLLLGSRERYLREFEARPGTYYLSAGWHERDRENGLREPSIASDLGTDRTYEEYAARFGEENARYIVDQLRGGLRYYDRLVFIRTGLGGEAEALEAGRARAESEGWSFEIVKADLSLLERLLAGDWDDDFAVLRPGEALRATHDGRILERVNCP